jgi:RNA polymerase sigma-70 factor, ECF subfamily
MANKFENESTQDMIDVSCVENQIREAFDSGNLDAAATLFIQRFGGEIFGFLVGRIGDAVAGAEVFSEFTEDFWLGLPAFKWRTTIRSWAYTLARNAFYRHLNAKRKHTQNVCSMNNSVFQLEAEKLRTATLNHLKTEIKSKMREIRERLPQDDQTLIILRIDQKMSWNELAVILSGEGDEMSDADKKRWAARLRKRFQTLKTRLKEMATAEGLLKVT